MNMLQSKLKILYQLNVLNKGTLYALTVKLKVCFNVICILPRGDRVRIGP